jgi:8-oxo-dGTP pyrophosphatase MutT (NUDIX family)
MRYPRAVLDLQIDREGVTPRDAATLVLVRDAGAGLEVFCVERNKKSRFLGGAVVFPGGKLDAADASDAWTDLVTEPRAPQASSEPFSTGPSHLRALAISACRETLEEAAMLPLAGGAASDDELGALRAKLAAEPAALRAWLAERRLRIDLSALHPFARWITPTAESRRFDARFFLGVAPGGQSGAHDEHETTASYWAAPGEMLARFDRDEIQLAPPTHRILALLAGESSAAGAIALAGASCLDPICPRLVPLGDTLALALPGDPEHAVREPRAPGRSRFVLRGDRWRPEDAP